jgi:hypothetical protein
MKRSGIHRYCVTNTYLLCSLLRLVKKIYKSVTFVFLSLSHKISAIPKMIPRNHGNFAFELGNIVFSSCLIVLRILENLKEWIRTYTDTVKRDEKFMELLSQFSKTETQVKEEESFFSFLRSVLVIFKIDFS